MAKLQLVPIVGQAQDRMWSQVLALPYGERQEDDFGVGQRRVLIAVTLEGEGVEAKGSEWLNGLRAEDEAIFQEYPFNTAWVHERGAHFPELKSLIVLGFTPNEVVCLVYGGARVILQRNQRVGIVATAPDNDWLLRKGVWHHGDRYLIGTQGLVGEVSTQLLTEVLMMGTVTLGGEELVTRVQAAEESAGAAGWLIEGVETVPAELVEPIPVEESTDEEASDITGKPDKPQVYLRKPKQKKMRLFMVALATLLVFGLSVVYTWNRREMKKWQDSYTALMAQVDPLLQSSQGGAEVNRIQAQKEVGEALGLLTQALPTYEKQLHYKTLIEQKIETVRQLEMTVSGEKGLASIPVWVDLAMAKEGVVGDTLAVAGNSLLILDKTNGLIVAVNGETREANLAAGGQLLKGSQLLVATQGRAVVYGTAGIVDVALVKKTSDVLVSPEPEWKEVVGIGLFAGNVYLLDKGEGTIWQYPGLTAGVGARRRWLADTQHTINTQALDMAIDGDVWVLSGSGAIERYRRGVRENFSLSGMNKELNQPVAIFTDEKVESLYVLDRGNSRVVVLSKTGDYQQQFVWQGFSAVTDIVVLPEQRVLVALSGSSLYRVPLD